MNWKQFAETNPVVTFLTAMVVAFVAGIGACEWLDKRALPTSPPGPQQRWLVIDRVHYYSTSAPVRVDAEVGGYHYSYPSSQLFSVNEAQSPERFALPIGLLSPQLKLTILRPRTGGGVDRFASQQIQVTNYAAYSASQSVQKFPVDLEGHTTTGLAPIAVFFHFE